jgi:hypothetical protein
MESVVTTSHSANRFGISQGLKSEQHRADEIGVHRITLARARAAGDLSFIRIGDRVLYSDQHIIEWLERCERKAKARKTAA